MPPRAGRPIFRTPTPDSSSEDESAANPNAIKAHPIPIEPDYLHDLDLSKRLDYVDFKPNPFTIAKIYAKRKSSSQEGGAMKKSGSIRPAAVDPDKPNEQEKGKGKDKNGKDTGTYKEDGWEVMKARPVVRKPARGRGGSTGNWGRKNSGWTNARGEAIPNSKPPKGWIPPAAPKPAPPKRSLLSEADHVMAHESPKETVKDKGKGKKTAPRRKPAVKGNQDNDKPVFRKIRESVFDTSESG